MEKIREAYKEYSNPDIPMEERPTQDELATKYHIPQPTLSYWFDKFDLEGEVGPKDPKTLFPRDERPPTFEKWQEQRSGADRGTQIVKRTTMKHAISNLAEKAKTTAEQAYIIGDLITTRYFDLINLAIAKGMKLEDFINDVFNFYERREEIETELSQLRTSLQTLIPLAEPNWRFQRKTEALLNFARQCLNAKIYGARINVKETTRALQTELDKIDEQTIKEMS
jgi:hypothetical protein